MTTTVDAVVVGAGPNGLVAAIRLADAGWDVLVLEAEDRPGGAVRSDDRLEPGWEIDRFSAFYPLTAASPHMAALDLDRHGLRWSHAPAVLAHPVPDGETVMVYRDVQRTAAGLDATTPGDGQAWLDLHHLWQRHQRDLVGAMMRPFPPVVPVTRLVGRAGPAGTGELARLAVLPARRLADERFSGRGVGPLLAGCALHADLSPEHALSGFFGWLLTGIAQTHGWPVPVGGASALTAALVSRLVAAGGKLRCSEPVTAVDIGTDGARGVRTAGGELVLARHGVLADVVAPKLFGRLCDPHRLPQDFRQRLRRHQQGAATIKVNWTLDAPVPWSDARIGDAGTVHLGGSMPDLIRTSTSLALGELPERPMVVLGQMTTADRTRSPEGTETLWGYADVPNGRIVDPRGEIRDLDDPGDAERFAARIEELIERHAPGFGRLVRRREIQTPGGLEGEDANLVRGDKNLGTARLHQQLVFRPTLGLGRAETPVPGLFLASASAHPGGGVHGACGANAAQAALWARRRNWRPWRRHG